MGRSLSLRDRPVIVAAVSSLLVTAALVARVLVIDKPGVMLILIPPLAGAILALWRPKRRGVVAVAGVLTAVTAVVSLIGGVGFLYVPSIVLFAWGLIARPRISSAELSLRGSERTPLA